jgi:hypothetical protein
MRSRSNFRLLYEHYNGSLVFVVAHGENRLVRFSSERRAMDYIKQKNLAQNLSFIPNPRLRDFMVKNEDEVCKPAQYQHLSTDARGH